MNVTNISNLKQNLSARLHAVQRGETFIVTDRNVPVALLGPLSPGMIQADTKSLIAEGVIRPRRCALDLAKLRELRRGHAESGLSAAIAEEREGR